MVSPWQAVERVSIVEEVEYVDCLIHQKYVPSFDGVFGSIKCDDSEEKLSISNGNARTYDNPTNYVGSTTDVTLR